MSPIVPRVMEPLNTRISSGSETRGEKLSLAQSFQNASLRRGSRPIVENDSICAMQSPPFSRESSCCVSVPTLVVELVIRNNQFLEPILSAYTCYKPSGVGAFSGQGIVLLINVIAAKFGTAICSLLEPAI